MGSSFNNPNPAGRLSFVNNVREDNSDTSWPISPEVDTAEVEIQLRTRIDLRDPNGLRSLGLGVVDDLAAQRCPVAQQPLDGGLVLWLVLDADLLTRGSPNLARARFEIRLEQPARDVLRCGGCRTSFDPLGELRTPRCIQAYSAFETRPFILEGEYGVAIAQNVPLGEVEQGLGEAYVTFRPAVRNVDDQADRLLRQGFNFVIDATLRQRLRRCWQQISHDAARGQTDESNSRGVLDSPFLPTRTGVKGPVEQFG